MNLAADTFDDHNDDHGRDRDLAWLAFRYVAGDLGEAQGAVFERRLGHDQEAREAVAEAILLAGAVTNAAAEVRQAARVRSRVLLASAACILIAAGLVFSQRRMTSESPIDPEKSLALAWSGLDQDGVEIVDPSSSFDDPTAIDPPSMDLVEAPPAWLVEAAALPAADVPSGGQGS